MVQSVFTFVYGRGQGTTEDGAMPAFCFGAIASIMTDAKIGPFIVQGPYDTLAALHYFFYSVKRKHSLTNPMQVDDIGFAKLSGTGDVNAHIGDVCLP